MAKKRTARKAIQFRCFECGDTYDDWDTHVTPPQRKHMAAGDGWPVGICPGCAEARQRERTARFAAKFAQRGNKHNDPNETEG